MRKYICADDFIDKYGAYPASTPTTLKQVCDELKAMPPADVIPVSWIREWFGEHYGTAACALVDDWRKK